jgi:hypothetical protein
LKKRVVSGVGSGSGVGSVAGSGSISQGYGSGYPDPDSVVSLQCSLGRSLDHLYTVYVMKDKNSGIVPVKLRKFS